MYLKDNVYKNNPQTIVDLKRAITDRIRAMRRLHLEHILDRISTHPSPTPTPRWFRFCLCATSSIAGGFHMSFLYSVGKTTPRLVGSLTWNLLSAKVEHRLKLMCTKCGDVIWVIVNDMSMFVGGIFCGHPVFYRMKWCRPTSEWYYLAGIVCIKYPPASDTRLLIFIVCSKDYFSYHR
jgi:predicted RNA-binding Zn-ribbon protein involved in translation (DUF1610 family)